MESTFIKVFGVKYQKVPDVALAPIADFTEPEVWRLLELYGLKELMEPQYTRWGRAPNCALCPLMSRDRFVKALGNLPTGYLKRVLSVLKEIRSRYREGTFSARKLDEWIPAIEEELRRRTDKR